MAALLEQVGRRQVDGDALVRQRQAERRQRRAHALAPFAHRLVGQADDVEARLARGHLHLHVDFEHLDALERDGGDARDHVLFLPRSFPLRPNQQIPSAATASSRPKHVRQDVRSGGTAGRRIRSACARSLRYAQPCGCAPVGMTCAASPCRGGSGCAALRRWRHGPERHPDRSAAIRLREAEGPRRSGKTSVMRSLRFARPGGRVGLDHELRRYGLPLSFR